MGGLFQWLNRLPSCIVPGVLLPAGLQLLQFRTEEE